MGSLLVPDENAEGLPPAPDRSAEIAFLVGWPLSTTAVIFAIGNAGDETGSLLWTLA